MVGNCVLDSFDGWVVFISGPLWTPWMAVNLLTSWRTVLQGVCSMKFVWLVGCLLEHFIRGWLLWVIFKLVQLPCCARFCDVQVLVPGPYSHSPLWCCRWNLILVVFKVTRNSLSTSWTFKLVQLFLHVLNIVLQGGCTTVWSHSERRTSVRVLPFIVFRSRLKPTPSQARVCICWGAAMLALARCMMPSLLIAIRLRNLKEMLTPGVQ